MVTPEGLLHTQTMLYGMGLALLLGIFGQGIRVIAGLKKQSDESAAKGQALSNDFDLTRLMVSLFIGAIAGLAAFLGLWQTGETDPTKGTFLFAIVTAGYSGTDFIEAFVKKYLPGKS